LVWLMAVQLSVRNMEVIDRLSSCQCEAMNRKFAASHKFIMVTRD
jgi:hypothetical protein